MEEKKEEVVKTLLQVEIELTFLSKMMNYVGMSNFELNSDDMLGASFLLDRIKEDIKESKDVLL